MEFDEAKFGNRKYNKRRLPGRKVGSWRCGHCPQTVLGFLDGAKLFSAYSDSSHQIR